MTTAVEPTATASNRVAHYAPLIDAETKRLEAHFANYSGNVRPECEVRTFVSFCLRRHLPLIRNWKEWSKTSLTEQAIRPLDELTDVIDPLVAKWRKGMELKTRTMPPLPFLQFSDLDYDDFEDETPSDLEERTTQFCNIIGCHVPLPLRLSPVFASKVYKGPDAELEYAGGYKVKVRTGQTVSKAVLQDVRKRFKDNPTYVAFWEALFESIGVTWASGNEAHFMLSTAPSDFVKLGELGEESCYQDGESYEKAKLYLAQIPNSVVLLVYRNKKVIGRAWGVLAPRAGGGEFSNFYLTPKRQVMPGLLSALKEVLDMSVAPEENKDTKYRAVVDQSHTDNIYVNGDSVLLCPPNKQAQVRAELVRAFDRFKAETKVLSVYDSYGDDDDNY